MLKVENIETWGFEHAVRGMRNPLNSWDKSDSEPITLFLGNRRSQFEKGEVLPPLTEVWSAPNCNADFVIGEADLDLMRRLYKAGPEHRKFLRQIFISMDIIAPLYWWKEFDTYKVGTTANSCSTMHKIASKEFSESDFSIENLISVDSNDIYEVMYNDFVADVLNSPHDEKTTDGSAIDRMPVVLINDDGILSPKGVMKCTIALLNRCRDLYLKTKDQKYWWQMIQLLPSSYNQRRTITMNYENAVSMLHQRSNHKLTEWHELLDCFVEKLPYFKDICELN